MGEKVLQPAVRLALGPSLCIMDSV